MICFISTAEHAYTHQQVLQQATGFRVRVVTYDTLLGRRQPALQPATYVFTDMDRLSIPQLVRAAEIYRKLGARGMRVLNDPARYHTRAGLLRRLFDAGINTFNAYRIEEGGAPGRWPVFLRTEGDHGQPVSDLLHSQAELDRAVSEALERGIPRSAMIAIEYAAEPVQPGLFRKLSIFRLGGASVAHTCVHDDQWLVKYGKKGIATPELYEDELRIVTTNPHWPAVHHAFDLAGVDYGRVDFGMVGGKVQIYEINTNPNLSFDSAHPSPQREESYRVFKQNYFAALQALDSTAPPSVIAPV